MSTIHALTDGPAPPAVSAPSAEGSLQTPDRPRTDASQFPSGSLSPTSARLYYVEDELNRNNVRPPSPSPSAILLQASFTPPPQERPEQPDAFLEGEASNQLEDSPTMHQNVFSIRDGMSAQNRARTSRRRTGPLSQISRERAALIRKLGACGDCRRRRVACHPSHHGLTWEDVVTKFHRAHSPTIQDLAPAVAAGRLSPPRPETQARRAQEAMEAIEAMERDEVEMREALASIETATNATTHQAMEIDPPTRPPSHFTASRSSFSVRTPLPAVPRTERTTSLPGINVIRNDLQASSTKILTSHHRGRYTDVRALLLVWQGDEDGEIADRATRELSEVFERSYRFTFQLQTLPASESGFSSSTWRWLSMTLDNFLDNNNQRDILKIVYYSGHSFMDGNREMTLASSRQSNSATLIRWNPIQSRLEQSYSDTLVIMDAAFYPCNRLVRHQGLFEIFAASISEEHYNSLGRATFTRLLAEQLRIRAARGTPLSVAELHSILLTSYPKVVHERHPEVENVVSYPAPLHMLAASNSRLPSIFLSPVQHSNTARSSFSTDNTYEISVSIQLQDDKIDMDAWNEWLRMMPEGVRDVKVEGPHRHPSFSRD